MIKIYLTILLQLNLNIENIVLLYNYDLNCVWIEDEVRNRVVYLVAEQEKDGESERRAFKTKKLGVLICKS